MKRSTGAFVGALLLLSFQVAQGKSGPSGGCSALEIVGREEWRARPPWRSRAMKMPLNTVIIEHTAGRNCETKPQCIRVLQFMQDYFMDYMAYSDIGYNFLVGGDGRVYEGRGWTHFGAHTFNFNTISLGVAFMGNFMEVEPSQKMIDAALRLIDCGVEKRFLTPTRVIHGHRDVLCTLSPGDKLYAIIRQWKNFKGGRISGFTC